MTRRLLIGILTIAAAGAAQSTIVVDTPMAPPEWALLERALLEANSKAADEFAKQYLDPRGYLLHTPRWGTLDGPDDAIESFFNWTLLYALGGSESVLTNYDRALEGHLLQYNEMHTELTQIAKNGAYHREFITQSDWFHTGEGMRAFMLYGLANPESSSFRTRMKRFAHMYMGDDPSAPNYDPDKKVIKSIWTGSSGPMMHKATTYDWVGDPVPGTFHLLHNSAGRGEMLDLTSWYPKMLAHCADYLDSVGDNPLNMGATLLGLNAYMLDGETEYKDWVLEYMDAWKARTAKAGGMVPTNVGLDGEPGGEYNGQWWKGTYGWNFTIYDGEIEQVASRNTVFSGPWAGFSNAYLLTGDAGYIDTLRKQIDLLYDNKKVENGKTLLPRMYGDPRGYKETGKPEYYDYGGDMYEDLLTQIYLWSMDRKDLERIPKDKGWIGFLEGNDPGYPVRSLRADLEFVRNRLNAMRNDPTSPDTRLADWLLGVMPVTTDQLTELTVGGYFGRSKFWALHSRVRYFDPERRRPGLPEDVGALVEKLSADSVTLTLVNLDQAEARDVVIQAGAYGEHAFEQGKTVKVHLEPGCGQQLELKMKRYVNLPTLQSPL